MKDAVNKIMAKAPQRTVNMRLLPASNAVRPGQRHSAIQAAGFMRVIHTFPGGGFNGSAP